MKKMSAFLIAAFLAYSLAACADPAAEPSTESSDLPLHKAGDIILADGSVIEEEDLTSIDANNFPIAVIAEIHEDGTALGVGVHRSEDSMCWQEAEEFSNTYAKAHGLDGEYGAGWYMPDISEVRSIYENREEINRSLQKIYELDSLASMDGLDTNWYWLSTLSETNEHYVWFVHFFNGYSSDCPDDFTNLHALAVRKF